MSSLRSDASDINCCTTWSCRLSRVYWIVGREERVRRGKKERGRGGGERRRGEEKRKRGGAGLVGFIGLDGTHNGIPPIHMCTHTHTHTHTTYMFFLIEGHKHHPQHLSRSCIHLLVLVRHQRHECCVEPGVGWEEEEGRRKRKRGGGRREEGR